MNINSPVKPPLTQLLAAIVIGMAGTAMFNLSPMILAAAGSRMQLNDQQLGWLMGAEVVGIAIASVAVLVFARRIGVRRLALIGALTVLFGNLLACTITHYPLLLALRFIVGCAGDGLLYACALVVLGQQAIPVRAFALFSFANMCVTGGILAVLPEPNAQLWLTLMLLLAALGAAAVLASSQLPRLVAKQDTGHTTPRGFPPWLALAGLFAFTLNLGAVWGFAAKVGTEATIPADAIATLLSLSILFQAAGSLTAAALGPAKRPRIRLSLIAVLQVAGLMLLAISSSESSYLAGLALWGFSWNFGLANLLGLLADNRQGNGLLALAPGSEALGAATGPALAGMLVFGSLTSSVVAVGLLGAMMAVLMFLPLLRFQEQIPAPTPSLQQRR